MLRFHYNINSVVDGFQKTAAEEFASVLMLLYDKYKVKQTVPQKYVLFYADDFVISY